MKTERPPCLSQAGSELDVQLHGVARGEPIAIVGMACRFPGADSPAEFWRRLAAGTDLISEGEPGSGVGRVGKLFPDTAERRSACRFGAYLEDLELFDAPFFRISPVEAQMLDPQQRLMLETSWRALEDAGLDPERLAGSRTGVYAGISNNEYRSLIMEASDTAEPAASLYTVTGTSFNTAIGRVAFALGLEGTGDGGRHRLLLVAGGAAPGGVGAAARRVRPGAGRRRAYDPVGATAGAARQRRHAVAGRALQDVRRRGQRLRARRGLRHPGPEAAGRGGGGRRPDLGRWSAPLRSTRTGRARA